MNTNTFRRFVAGVIATVAGAGIILAAEVTVGEQEWLAAIGGCLVGLGVFLLITFRSPS